MGMKAIWVVPVLVSILILGVLGYVVQESNLSTDTEINFTPFTHPIIPALADDDDDGDDACSAGFTCVAGDDDETCPDGFECEAECDDDDSDDAPDCELKECEIDDTNDDTDDGICARPVGPVCETPPDPLEGNLIIFVNEDNIGICGIECTVQEIVGCNLGPVLDQGTTDGNGMLSLTIPSGLSTISIGCNLSAVGGFDVNINVPVTEPITEVDIPKDSFNSPCCPI